MITIIDYGMGNLRSVQKAVEYVGGSASITSKPKTIARADALILPGVGAFAQAMKNLKQKKLVPGITEHIKSDKPFLGICLGFELLFDTSTENGMHRGLSIFKGSVRRFPFKGTSQRPVPHMGWNRVAAVGTRGRMMRLVNNEYFYFVHSYCVHSHDTSGVFGLTDYGVQFQSAIERGNLFACQFHPEKSGTAGLAVIDYFVKQVAS
ncbi:MAG: imidazole glycerol phosphate synthase subunit HisH [Elusimicrobia bacterium]|nr:imidazole glycerol phosphate synthase subunit HisH [Elusimicrobiota bacterium]MBD3411904.1 imidazole glycerol phosphate synthase subunit HisH [Elusimicrobiota bacterium]